MEKNLFRFFTICVVFIIISVSFVTKKSYALESTYQGYDVVGKIEIPKISLSLPILGKVTAGSLKVSVAFQWGSGINQVGNSVIIGHNQKDGTMFSDLDKLENGDYIKITDMDDNVVNYKVYDITTTSAEDTSFYDRDTKGKREITLSSSTDDSSARFLVFAVETSDVIDDSNNNSDEKEYNNQDTSNSIDNANSTNSTNENNINSNNSSNNTFQNIASNNRNDTSTAKTALPKAGTSLVLIMFIFITSICSVIVYIKLKYYKQVK